MLFPKMAPAPQLYGLCLLPAIQTRHSELPLRRTCFSSARRITSKAGSSQRQLGMTVRETCPSKQRRKTVAEMLNRLSTQRPHISNTAHFLPDKPTLTPSERALSL